MISEIAIQGQIVQYLRTRHIFAWRNNTGISWKGGRPVKYGSLGSPDILGVLKPSGKLLAIEVKRPGAKPSPFQAKFIENLAGAGAIVIVASSLEDVAGALEQFGYGVAR